MIVLLGPTASGKTRLAVRLARLLDGEIISADSRQVYRGMNLGTGKDLGEYGTGLDAIPFHLIDIADPGHEYSVYAFQHDFLKAWQSIQEKGKEPVLCGGTGMYIEAVLHGYRFVPLDPDPDLELLLESKSMEELTGMLKTWRTPHNSTDLLDRKRLIRAIRIGIRENRQTEHHPPFPKIPALVFGIDPGRETVRQRITARLHQRLKAGMTEEVQGLLDAGITAENLMFYGLEYKYITLYLLGKLSYDEMVTTLNQRIHQFAKRQMTWFRRMEKKGILIHWIDPSLSEEEAVNRMAEIKKANTSVLPKS